MKSTEPMDVRLKMVEMHSFFQKKIDESVEAGNYFEASWLIYSCLENRFFRVLDKYKKCCKYCVKGGKCRKGNNQLAISTKIACVERLAKAGVSCISESFDSELIGMTRTWVKQRNNLMHNLLALDTYEERFDDGFRDLALDGQTILNRVYKACEKFRADYFADGYVFVFPESCMEECSCKPRNKANGDASPT